MTAHRPSSSSSPSSVAQSALAVPTPEQQRLLDRIALQRERLRARRAAQSQALAQRDTVVAGMDETLVLRAAGFVREHPVAVAALAGVALVAGPRRLIRWAGVALPILMRLRR